MIITRQNIVSDAESFAWALVEAGANIDAIVICTMSKLLLRVPDDTGIKQTGN